MNEKPATNPSSWGRYDRAVGPEGRTHYERAGVCVTDQYLVVSGRRYEVGELNELRVIRGPHDPVAVSALVFALVLVLAIAIGVSQHDSLSGWVTLTAVALIPLGTALVVCRVRRRRFELWATYRGVEVRVLDISRAEEFGQIRRALIRAREARVVPSRLNRDQLPRRPGATTPDLGGGDSHRSGEIVRERLEQR